jgi:hypothetical protein
MSAAPSPSTRCVPRFDRVERVVHWITATLMLTLLATGSVSTSARCRRWSGGATSCARCTCTRVAAAGPAAARDRDAAGAELRADLGRLNRWSVTIARGGDAGGARRAARQVQSRPEVERDIHRRAMVVIS